MIEDINEVHKKALNSGCKEVQRVKKMVDYGVSNSMFVDKSGYVWMPHQIYREVIFEESSALEKIMLSYR